ncbi:hypothetical protein HYH03_016835 [Edaphochlamys debaryana]|uniref:Uncharacterized protein n=1 Tax=Edaphochlamys debaryana TaxID=47281 RepID=A0A836BPJ9_9CHLO|nr:hypothetical protein HYH03_016835 [Edaphochlamys debaryana]|eukprot:KAG2484421.1 hypothetical protein HYH03_016835 [Edaphochlamys debaryana]
MLHLLLQEGAQRDAVSPDDGCTALHFAAMNGQAEAAKALLAAGAKRDAVNKDHATALDLARDKSHTDLEALLQA